jgi:hypothetical protein
METPSPELIDRLRALKKMLVAFIKAYQNLDSNKEKKKHHIKAINCADILKKNHSSYKECNYKCYSQLPS